MWQHSLPHFCAEIQFCCVVHCQIGYFRDNIPRLLSKIWKFFSVPLPHPFLSFIPSVVKQERCLRRIEVKYTTGDFFSPGRTRSPEKKYKSPDIQSLNVPVVTVEFFCGSCQTFMWKPSKWFSCKDHIFSLWNRMVFLKRWLPFQGNFGVFSGKCAGFYGKIGLLVFAGRSGDFYGRIWRSLL